MRQLLGLILSICIDQFPLKPDDPLCCMYA